MDRGEGHHVHAQGEADDSAEFTAAMIFRERCRQSSSPPGDCRSTMPPLAELARKAAAALSAAPVCEEMPASPDHPTVPATPNARRVR
jgi:hypothetical protein